MNDRSPLEESDLDPDPLAQFGRWYGNAEESGLAFPDAMVVATASADGAPSARHVLLKGFDRRGFVFYTNYESRKGRDLQENPRAALVFYWQPLHRQVLIRGSVERVPREDSERYWETRPPGSRLAAAISRQTEPIRRREELESRFAALSERFPDGKVPLPSFWGGFRVVPESFEFWQGRENRLHDRFQYVPDPRGGWRIERLQP